jgi:hypothetical protein
VNVVDARPHDYIRGDSHKRGGRDGPPCPLFSRWDAATACAAPRCCTAVPRPTGCWMPAVRLASPSSPTNRQVHPRVRRKARVAVTPIRTARKPAMRFGGDRIHAAAAKPMSAQSSSGSPTASIPTAGIPGGSLSPVTPRVPATSQGALLVRRGQSQQGFGRRSCCLVSTTWPPRWNLPF